MTDQDAILLLSMLESQAPLWGGLPTVICQLHVPSNIKQLSESLGPADEMKGTGKADSLGMCVRNQEGRREQGDRDAGFEESWRW